MPIRWDKRNKRYRFEFNRTIQGRQYRRTRLLPEAWDQAQADAYARQEEARLYAIASGTAERDPAIDEAVKLYAEQRKTRKAHKQSMEHLAAIFFAYHGKPMSELESVAKEVSAMPWAPATIRQRLTLLKAACRLAWRKGMVRHDPTHRMEMPAVRNERHIYIGRRDMLRACRACTNWQAQVAIRVAFYTGMRLGELWRIRPDGDTLVLEDSKNSDRRSIPVHPRIRHLMRLLPLKGPKITVQRAWERARDRAGLGGVKFHDLRHSAASEMVNAGVDLYVVGKVLGHRDSRSTQRYAHLNADSLRSAVGKIGG